MTPEVWLKLDLTEERCTRRSFLKLGGECGARKVRVQMSEEAQRLAAHFGCQIKHGDTICASDRSECGMINGMKLRTLLGILQ